MLVVGVDLAWGEGSKGAAANETGVVVVDGSSGEILEAEWTVGLDDTISWMERVATPETLAMVDAPLVVTNTTGQRRCEKQVGQRYGRWKVSANSTNTGSTRLAGVKLRERLEGRGWRYDDGRLGPPSSGRTVSEVYPYTALVGTPGLGYDNERPVYKRKPRRVPAAGFRPMRATTCDELVGRLSKLGNADPPLKLLSHAVTARLVSEMSPINDREYKHREDLIDAVLCAWTGLLWLAHGFGQCQVLGADQDGDQVATIIAPARPEQRLTRR